MEHPRKSKRIKLTISLSTDAAAMCAEMQEQEGGLYRSVLVEMCIRAYYRRWCVDCGAGVIRRRAHKAPQKQTITRAQKAALASARSKKRPAKRAEKKSET
jgi:hypothetical protein